jgi:hypothetical protein
MGAFPFPEPNLAPEALRNDARPDDHDRDTKE